jgi:hypothetical protein
MSFPPWESVDVLKHLTFNVSESCARMTQLNIHYHDIQKYFISVTGLNRCKKNI